jgi:Tfp pilus assembly protein PilO
MSYALRNTLILLVVLLLFGTSGFLFIRFYQQPKIEQLVEEVSTLQTEYDRKKAIADQLPELEVQFEESKMFIENFDKTLFRTNNPDRTYRYLSLLSETDPIEFDFVFSDSTSNDRYGIIVSQLSGRGPYTAVLNFLTRIENSEPVQKIEQLVISPVNEAEEYSFVTFTLRLSSYYDRLNYFNASGTPDISGPIAFASYNPFYPLIRNVEPNTENRINIEQSQLVGIGNGIIYLMDQNGSLQTLQEGDRVYLGILQTININQGIANFRLNKGGIIESVSLEVER